MVDRAYPAENIESYRANPPDNWWDASYMRGATPAQVEVDPVTGIPWSVLQEIVGHYESGNNYARDDNSESTASGRYQFVDGTAGETLGRLGLPPGRANAQPYYVQNQMFRDLWAKRAGKDWKASEQPHGEGKRGWAAEIHDYLSGVPIEEIRSRRTEYEANKGQVDFLTNTWWRDLIALQQKSRVAAASRALS